MFTDVKIPRKRLNYKQDAEFIALLDESDELKELIRLTLEGCTLEKLAALTRAAYDLGKTQALDDIGQLIENLQ